MTRLRRIGDAGLDQTGETTPSSSLQEIHFMSGFPLLFLEVDLDHDRRGRRDAAVDQEMLPDLRQKPIQVGISGPADRRSGQANSDLADRGPIDLKRSILAELTGPEVADGPLDRLELDPDRP